MLQVSLLKGLPVEHYSCIVSDVPWHFKSNSKANPGRNPLAHYDCMSLDEIAALPVKQVAADDAWLFFWITGPFLAIGAHLPIFKAWGFEPSGMGFVWIKLNPRAPQMIFMPQDIATGGGFTTRKNAEFCLIGRRGSPKRLSAGIHEVIIAPRREHSRKPDESIERIERFCVGPRLELFGRQSRPGWEVRGNQATMFDTAAQEWPVTMAWEIPPCAMETAPVPPAAPARPLPDGPNAVSLLHKLRSGMRPMRIPRLDSDALPDPEERPAE